MWHIDVQRVAKDASVARVLYTGSAILRGLPAWVPFLEAGCARFKKRKCASLGGQPASGLRMPSARAGSGWAVEPWARVVGS